MPCWSSEGGTPGLKGDSPARAHSRPESLCLKFTLTDFPLSWPFWQGFYKLEEASPSFSTLTEPVEPLRSPCILDGLRRVLGARGLWVPTPTPRAPALFHCWRHGAEHCILRLGNPLPASSRGRGTSRCGVRDSSRGRGGCGARWCAAPSFRRSKRSFFFFSSSSCCSSARHLRPGEQGRGGYNRHRLGAPEQ